MDVRSHGDLCGICKMPMVRLRGTRKHRTPQEREACYLLEDIIAGAKT